MRVSYRTEIILVDYFERVCEDALFFVFPIVYWTFIKNNRTIYLGKFKTPPFLFICFIIVSFQTIIKKFFGASQRIFLILYLRAIS